MGKKFFKGCLIGCLISIGAFILLVAGFVGYLYITAEPSEYTDPKDYLIIKDKIEKQEKIKHFPAKIPENATEVSMYGYTDMPYNGEMLLLEFKIDRQYIEKELNKYDFWNKKDKIGEKQKNNLVSQIGNIDTRHYTYYVIREPENERGYREFFPYYNGIGVDGNKNKILYYHIYPAD